MKEEAELDEAVNEKQIKKDIDSGNVKNIFHSLDILTTTSVLPLGIKCEQLSQNIFDLLDASFTSINTAKTSNLLVSGER